MIGLDTNIIIYAIVTSQPEHEAAARWLAANGDSLVTTPINLGEVLRLLTHPRVFPKPVTLKTAIELMRHFLDHYQVRIVFESEAWWDELKELVTIVPGIRGNEIFDARIALCLRFNGVKGFCTLDSDFAKYSFLSVRRI